MTEAEFAQLMHDGELIELCRHADAISAERVAEATDYDLAETWDTLGRLMAAINCVQRSRKDGAPQRIHQQTSENDHDQQA